MLDSLHIKNFRCFEDLTIPSLGRVNLIVGKNNSGKSTLLEAVSIFVSGKNMHDNEEMAASKLIEQIRKILINRNVFFLSEEKPSDVEVFGEMLFDKNELRVHFENSSKTEVLQIYPAKIKETKLAMCFSMNNNQKIKMTLDEKFNMDTSWQNRLEDDYQDHLAAQKNQNNNDGDDQNLKLIFENINKTFLYSFHNEKFRFVPSGLVLENNLSYLWDAIYRNNKDSDIIKILKIILPNISSLNFSANPNSKERAAFVKEYDDSESKPIKALGEGIGRLLQIFLYAFLTRNGYLTDRRIREWLALLNSGGSVGEAVQASEGT